MMKTSSFFIYTGKGKISIARSAPRGVSGFRNYRPLNPTKEMLRMNYDEYRSLYFNEILGKLNASQVWEQLHLVAGDAEPVLLCWERLHKSSEWCHRRMVAAWFEEKLGYVVKEYNHTPQLPIF